MHGDLTTLDPQVEDDAHTTRPRILLVDDEEGALEGMRLVLRRACDVVTARGGVEALRLIEASSPFTVIVSDLRMPGLDGVRLLRQARVACPDTVRVLVTGHADVESALRAVNDGHVFRILLKPCPPETLRAAVEDGVDQYRMVTADRRLMERKLEQLSAQLLHADRLATLGTLAGGVGHEVGNILSVLGMLMHGMAVGSTLREDQMGMLQNVYRHLKTHVRHLLDLGKPHGGAAPRSDLREAVEKTLELLASVKRTGGTRVVADLGEKPLLVPLSVTQVEQIVINLAGNAFDAMSDRPALQRVLRVRLDDQDEATVTCHVEDNGSGIPADLLESVFQPYFTTKPADRGTGLGLPVVRQLVRAAGGDICVRSEEGQGTCFSFTLPRSSEPGPAHAP